MSGARVPPPHPLLTDAALAEIYAHARGEHPNECCGLVFGPKEAPTADRVLACVNIQDRLHAEDPVANPRDARMAYGMDTADLLKVNKSLRSEQPVKIVYHSHIDRPGDGAYFSDTDQRVAQYEGVPWYQGVEYVVVDVKTDGVHGAAQFAWSDTENRYVEIGRYD